MTAKQTKKQNGAKDLGPRAIKGGSREAAAIKGGTHPVDKSSAALMQHCASAEITSTPTTK